MIKGLSPLQLYNSVEFSISLSPCSTLSEKSLKEIQFFKFKLFYKMSTTRSQKRRNDQQSASENVSEGLISPIVVENPCSLNQDDEVAGPSKPKSPRIENSLLESLRASLKEEITSEIKNLLIESQKEMLKLLKPETRGIIRENTEEEVEEETRNFYTPTKSVRISSTQNDSMTCRNISSFHCSFLLLLCFISLMMKDAIENCIVFSKNCNMVCFALVCLVRLEFRIFWISC